MGCAKSGMCGGKDHISNNRHTATPVEVKSRASSTTQNSPNNFGNAFKFKYRLSDELLGENDNSVVKVGYQIDSGKKVAIKMITRVKLETDEEIRLRQGVQVCKALVHSCIICILDFFEEEKYFILVMELATGGDLFTKITKSSSTSSSSNYPETQARELIFNLLSAIKYCHHQNIVHRNLKLENILLATDSSLSDIRLKSFKHSAKAAEPACLSTQTGSPEYIAPEILNNQYYGQPIDMWAIGVITFILLGGYAPFEAEHQKELFRRIRRAQFDFEPKVWRTVSDEAKQFIQKLLVIDPAGRLTATEALNHPWILRDGTEVCSASTV